MEAWGQAEPSRKWKALVERVKGTEGSTVSSKKGQQLALARIKCVLNTGLGEGVKRYIGVEYKTLSATLRSSGPHAVHSGEPTDVFRKKDM